MGLMKAFLLALIFSATVEFSVCSNNCAQTAPTTCPGPPTTAMTCRAAGCWWCSSTMTCVLGKACASTAFVRNCWRGAAGAENANDCRNEYGCSWCASAADPKCREFYNPDQLLTCAQPLSTPACGTAATEATCRQGGCWWCAVTDTQFRCIRGIECTKPDKVNCWEGSGTPNANDCRNKFGCSWCPDSPVRCAREYMPPMPGPMQCLRPASKRTGCGITGPNKPTKCMEAGCWWCPGGIIPDCIRGVACQRIIKINCWPPSNTGTPNAKDCRLKYGCSWCPTTVTNQPQCLAETNECAREKVDRTPCFNSGQAATEANCLSNGCFWCPNHWPRCTTGMACRDLPKENCWPSTNTNTPNSGDCRKTYRCSWCKNEPVNKCLRPRPLCNYKEVLNCFPFADPNIPAATCTGTTGCEYCPTPSNRLVKCVRAMCPTGQVKRYGQNSCCVGVQSPLDIGIDPRFANRIIGGMNAQLQRWPWMGSYRLNNDFECGCVLINAQFSITAAHCRRGASEAITVRYGFIDRANPGPNAMTTAVTFASQMSHPDYSTTTSLCDIMILPHVTPITTTGPYITPISLPRGEVVPPGMTCFVTGWGEDSTGTNPNILQEASVLVFNPSICIDAYTNLNAGNVNKIVCAGRTEGGVDSCQGDSGGPLVCQRCRNCDWYLAGLVSFGTGCAIAQFPGVYANMNALEGWVKTIISGLPATDPNLNCNFY